MAAVRLLVPAAIFLCACSTPPPATVPGGMVTVGTDPLTLTVGDLTATRFVEVGTVPDPIKRRYWDPANPQGVTFSTPARATGWDPATKTLTLEGGAQLIVSDGVLTLDVSKVPNAVLARFVLPADEPLYGMGGTEDTPESMGVVREMQLRIDTTSTSSTNERHVPVPLAIWPRHQLGVYADEPRPGAFDVGAARPGTLLVTYATPRLALDFYAGDARAILTQYTAQTGAPRVPPEWSWFPIQWRNEVTQAQFLDDAMQMRANHIPGSTMWIDNPWQTGYDTFQFDTARFPDAADTVAQLESLGYHVLVWSTPYVNVTGPTADDHAEGAASGYLVTDGTGKPFDFPWTNGPGALVDFFDPNATSWWRDRIGRVTSMGFRGFKLDFAEDLVPELGGTTTPFTTQAGGSDLVHAAYAGAYHRAYLGALPDNDGFLLTRAGGPGTQTDTTAVWPGDLDRDFRRHQNGDVGGLPAAISVGLSLSASGFPFYGSDIGGFRGGQPTTEALLRWAEYAALGTIMQLGGGGPSHNPWDATLYDAQALPIYVKYARLHADLFPYLYSLAQGGAPLTLPPGLLVPGHPYEDDFFCGDALFVAPVVEPGATTRTVTLPPGDWIDWWSGVKQSGTVTATAPLDTLPLWRRTGAIVVLLATACDTMLPSSAAGVVSCADPANRSPLRVVVTPSGDATFALYDGGSVEVHLNGDHVDLATHAGAKHHDFSFELDWRNTGLPAPTGVAYDTATGVARVSLSGDATATVR